MQNELKPMTVATLKVARKSEFGAFLEAGTGNSDDDILLHKFQQTAPVKVGDSVKVFLYLDPKKRLTASMRVPKIEIGQVARLKVINVTDAGAFLDAGAERGIFMPFAEMYGRLKVGDEVPARLYLDEKTGRLALSMKIPVQKPPKMKVGQVARLRVIDVTDAGAFLEAGADHGIFMPVAEMLGSPKAGDEIWARLYVDTKSKEPLLSMKVAKELWRASEPVENIQAGSRFSGYVFEITEAGAFLFTDERYVIFIARKNFNGALHVGKTVEALAKTLLSDGTIEGEIVSFDAEKILQYIRENGGVTDFNDKTEPEKIFETFKMSKRAFKQAIGHLLKTRLIEKTDSGFKIV